jgi:hypothetical protein
MGFKASTIKQVIRNRLKDWADSITDEAVRELVKAHTIVSGGCIASMYLGEKINDFDLYFRNKETAMAVAKYYVGVFNATKGELKTTAIASCNPVIMEETRKNIKGEEEDRIIIYMKSAGVAGEDQTTYSYFENGPEGREDEFFASLATETPELVTAVHSHAMETSEQLREDLKSNGKPKYRPIFMTDNAITLSDKVQLVVRFFGEPSKIHENYDFAHAMCYYDWACDKLECPAEALESMLSKSLVYKGSLYPICSLFRIRKFLERGWRISAGQMLKIIFQLKDVDMTNPLVLKEQLIGVDMAYMGELIDAISRDVGNGTRIDATYLAKLVDTIFDKG